MTVKCCGTCDNVEGITTCAYWCVLADEPVKFDECCDSWKQD